MTGENVCFFNARNGERTYLCIAEYAKRRQWSTTKITLWYGQNQNHKTPVLG
jgi:hypothetical protein